MRLDGSWQRNVYRRWHQKVSDAFQLLAAVRSRAIVRFGQRTGKDLLAGITHAAQIDLRFGDLASECLEFDVGGRPGKL